LSSTATAWSAPAAAGRGRPRWGVPEWFLIAEFAFQLALLWPQLNQGAVRTLWRVGIFAVSLGLLVLLPGKTRRSPANVAAIWVLAILGLELFHPLGNTWLSALAEAGMYLAILAPLFWMTRLRLDARRFRRTIGILWGYASVSAAVGLLQVYYPGRFEPTVSPMVASMGQDIAGLKIVLANGRTIFRPMGLTDIPGGAATAGMWAVLFGLGFLLTARPGRGRMLRRGVFLASMGSGVLAIYLSQDRALLVVLAVWFAALLALLGWRRRWREFAVLAVLALMLGAGALRVALGVGGASVGQRLAALTGGQAQNLYEQERGHFLAQTLHTLLPRYPLGAGLGRWGMMNTYFGENRSARRGLIYVEIQWQGWVLDGGVPLLVAYLLLLALTMTSLWRLARRRGPLWMWAALCLAYDVGVMALTFDYTPFTGEPGLQFWFLNALVLTAAAAADRAVAPRGREGRGAPGGAGA
jgi:hypothetical protein